MSVKKETGTVCTVAEQRGRYILYTVFPVRKHQKNRKGATSRQKAKTRMRTRRLSLRAAPPKAGASLARELGIKSAERTLQGLLLLPVCIRLFPMPCKIPTSPLPPEGKRLCLWPLSKPDHCEENDYRGSSTHDPWLSFLQPSKTPVPVLIIPDSAVQMLFSEIRPQNGPRTTIPSMTTARAGSCSACILRSALSRGPDRVSSRYRDSRRTVSHRYPRIQPSFFHIP